MKRRVLINGVGVAVLIALLWPRKYTMCPEWTVRVMDSSGAAMAGVPVRRACADYSTDRYNHSDELRTDATGTVRFTIDTRRMPLVERIAGAISQARMGVHASFGRRGSVDSLGRGPTPENVFQWYGEENRLSHTIQINPAPSP